MSKKFTGLLLFSILIVLIMVPISFAQDDTLLLNDSSSDDALISVSANESNVLTSANEYYFDASAENDGNGSFENPFKYLNDNRLYDNSVIHLASGEYTLSPSKTHSNVTIYGENSIIRGNGKALTVTKYFSLNNLTIANMPITNQATFMASGVTFANSTAKSTGSYGNSYGGSIYCINTGASIYLDSCIFENAYAEYGGAIYAVGCILDIRNSSFYNCTSNNFGGAISGKNTKNISISRSKFYKCYSINDAGGAINIESSTINATSLEFINCKALVGGALTSLNSVVYLDGIYCFNNSAVNGGAIYHMYGNFTVQNSIFTNNSAINGGALFLDNSKALIVKNNDFINNTASYCAGALFSLLNELSEPFENNYQGNSALIIDDEYVSSEISLTIGSGNYTMFKVNSTSVYELPSRYSLIDEGYVTSVKNQESGGNCWAFATLAVLESCILKASNVTYDLSEENMKNLMALYSDYGWKINTNDGGNDWMSWGYLTSWLGPINESDDKTDDLSLISPVFNSIAHIQNILFLSRDNYTDNDAIKQAILNYGAVGTSMAMYGTYLKNNAYYCYSNDQINHAVAIVGWDDNYSKSNFKKTPEGDGAWIVKNSWGTSWADKGYFYVSYYDKGFAQPQVRDVAYTFILNDTIRFDTNYQYDISGRTDYFLNASSSVWYKNVFTSSDDEYLAAVSTYFEKLTNWTVTVNVNNELATSKSGTCNPGYYTIDLDNMIPLKAGDVFEVIFTIAVEGDAAFPISEVYSLNNMAYKSNVSYASWNGIDWVDLFDFEFKYSSHWYDSQVACIKAFTIKDIINTTLSLSITDEWGIVARVYDQYGNLLKNGNVTVDVNGIIYELNIAEGVCVLANSLNQTHNVITALFSQIGYNSSTNAAVVDIPKTNVDLSMNISRFLNNAVIYIESPNNINTILMVKINNKAYPVIVSKGKGYLNLTGLENGLYAVEINCDELSLYQFDDLSGSFEIDAKETKIISKDLITFEESGALFNVTLVDENDAVLADKELSIVLNNSTIIKNTDSYGCVSIPVNLTNGHYLIGIDFNGDADYFKSNQTNGIKVKMNVDIDVSVNRSVNDVVVSVNLSKAINESLTVVVNDKSYSINSTAGMALLELFDLSNGLYNLSVSLDDFEDYHFLAANSTFVIDVKDTEIISNDLTINDEDDFQFNVTLSDENGVALANKNITFLLNGMSYNEVSDDEGGARISLDLDSGDYNIRIIFEGDNDYFNTTVSNVIKVKSKVNIDVFADVYQNSVSLSINMSKPINDTLFVRFNKDLYAVNSTNGKAVLNLADLSNGVHNVSVGLDDDVYDYLPEISMFAVDVKNTQIISSDLLITDEDDVNFNITLTDENGVALANKNVTFVLDGVIYNKITDADGIAFVPVDLAMGEYDVAISFEGDNNYFQSVRANIIKVKTHVDIDISSDVYQNNVTVKINMSKSIDDDVAISVNGKKYCVSSNNGNALLELSNLSNGVYDVGVSLDENNYDCHVNDCSFAVDVKVTKIESADLIINEGNYANFYIALTDEDGITLSERNVTFVLNGVIYNKITDADGVAFVPVNMTNGKYDVSVGFAGDSNHFASNASSIIMIKKNVTIALKITKSLNNAVIGISLSKPVSGSLTVMVNDMQYKINSNNGETSLNLSDLANGKYAVAVSLDNEDCNSQVARSEFIINIRKDQTAPNEVAVVDDERNCFNLTIVDENNCILANANVSIVLDDIQYNLVSDENGQVSIPLDLTLGQHAIDVYIIDENNQTKAIKSDSISIKSKVDLDYKLRIAFDKTFIDVNMSKDINGTLEIVVDNESYMLPISNRTMSLELPAWDGDIHDIQIRIVEGDIYEFKGVSQKVSVTFKKTKILVNDLSTYYMSGDSFTVTLVDENGNPLSGCEVHFRFSNNLITAKTDTSGRASINVSLIDGDYDIFVSFNGNENYYNSSDSAKISVKSTIVLTDSLNKTYGSYYSFKLLDCNGNPLKNRNVVVALNGINYAAASDKKGIVSIQIAQQPGSYDLTIYNPVNGETLSRTISVLERITQNNNITIYAYSSKEYKVLVLDDDGNPETAGKIVAFKINGKTYSVKTDKNGYARLKLSLGAKQYTITAEYKGYIVSNKVTVKPVLTAKNISKKKAKSYKFQAKLVDKNGKALKGKKITFKIKGKKYTAKTNKKGVATVTIKLSLKVGSYKIYTSYGKSKITNTLKIKK